MINIVVNGNTEELDEMTLSDYLAYKNIEGATVVIELNQNIINKDEFDSVKLNENDKLEVIRFVGGG